MPDTGQMMLISLIFMRMSGFIMLNPVLGRKNIPGYVKGAIIMVFTLLLYSFSADQVVEPVNSIEYSVLLIKEFAMGYIIGFIMDLFIMVITSAGTVMDFQMGLSMATVFDPQSNAQIALTGGIYHAYFMLLFFAVDGHLVLMKLLIQSSQLVPYGQVVIGTNVAWAIADIFVNCFNMAIRFSFPILAIEFITEIAVGILMKVIPQINVFVVNIQAKVFVGLLMLVFFFSPMSEYVGEIINQMLATVQNIIGIL